ncbi:MAG: hypothetical protein M3N93_02055, partial [Acidobacteriota bacterium]|nr:hypothetical protein [Acidobacteriota bacterium]
DAPAPIYAQPPTKKSRQLTLAPQGPVLRARVSPPSPKPKVPQKGAPIQWVPLPYQTPRPVAPTLVPTVVPGEVPAEQASTTSPPSPEPRHVTLPTGMTVAIRLDQAISSDRATPGDIFQASLAEPLVVDHLVIAERGAPVTGRILDAQRGARIGNPSLVELALTSVFTSDGQRVTLSTDPWVKQADRPDDAIGIIFSRPKPVNVAAAAVIRFRLSSRVTVTEQIAAR